MEQVESETEVDANDENTDKFCGWVSSQHTNRDMGTQPGFCISAVACQWSEDDCRSFWVRFGILFFGARE